VAGKDDCNTRFLGISSSGPLTSNEFKSFKNWLVPVYDFGIAEGAQKTDYQKMFSDYGKEAVGCANEAECLSSSGEAVKIYSTSGSLNINQTGLYDGSPRILFVNNTSDKDALRININRFEVEENTGLIFVVNGDVTVNYGVESVDGLFLVEGKFSTGHRSVPVGNKEAGRFAAIKIGRDGFARIAYLSENNIRFIRCRDLDCVNRDYEVLTSVGNVVSLNMTLWEEGAQDLPKVVIGQRDDSNDHSILVSCLTENCLTTSIIDVPNARDPDIESVSTHSNVGLGFGVGDGTNPRELWLNSCDGDRVTCATRLMEAS
jgi:hypothetical protein